MEMVIHLLRLEQELYRKPTIGDKFSVRGMGRKVLLDL